MIPCQRMEFHKDFLIGLLCNLMWCEYLRATYKLINFNYTFQFPLNVIQCDVRGWNQPIKFNQNEEEINLIGLNKNSVSSHIHTCARARTHKQNTHTRARTYGHTNIQTHAHAHKKTHTHTHAHTNKKHTNTRTKKTQICVLLVRYS